MSRVVLYLALGTGAAVMLFPFAWMVLSSLKTFQEVSLSPPTLLPADPQWSNYVEAWTAPPSGFGRYFLNSLVVAVLGTALQLATGITAAYAFARMQFRFSNALFVLVLATMMIPFEAKVVPNYVLIRHIPLAGGNDLSGAGGAGLYDTYAGMILPGVASAFAVFLLRQAFMAVPHDYWDAVRIDGGSHWTFLWRVLIPMTMPAVLTVVLFGLIARWNELLWPLIATQTESIRPVQLGLMSFSGDEGSLYHLLMAATTLVALPGIAVFLLAQRRFIEGLASFGVKG
ncbi:MAG: carbohydrate ABC transporter permease [Ornithinimicrobium sp.]|uniref:carbohydrate ABC transporter permease n=1 Tax=Ornithinimicrobium sp. TaxID=1977084 RepID=UPI003D9B9437